MLFVALYVSAFNLGALVFAFIERAFPEPPPSVALREAIRWPVALLVVAVPALGYVTRLIGREVRLDPSKRTSEIRGELTVRFLFKSATAAGIAGVIFRHYLRDMRVEVAETAV